MIYINEWLPNPAGSDNAKEPAHCDMACAATHEFVELYNSGNAPVGLKGWVLKTEGGRKFSLAGRSIPARGYLLLTRGETKLSLRNTDGGLSLVDATGVIVDRAQFLGSAPEGKSFSRVDYDSTEAEHFVFVDPTPGAANKTINAVIAARSYPFNIPLNRQLENSEFFAIMMGTAVLLTGLVIYVVKAHEDISKLFFGGNEKIRRSAR